MEKKAEVNPPVKRGRPRADDPGASVSTWLRHDDHDKLIQKAREQDRTVSDLVRHWLRLRLR